MSSIAPLTLENLAKVPHRSPSLASPAPAKSGHSTSLSPPHQLRAASSAPTPTAALAASAIVARERDGALFSPSLASILFSCERNGAGDKELLKALLAAKSKEDERLAALDVLRAEQLRAATVLAQHQAYWMAASMQSSQYSPTSPLSAGSNQSYPPWKAEGYPQAHAQQQQHPGSTQALSLPTYNYPSPSNHSSGHGGSPPGQPLGPHDNDAERRKRKRSPSARDAAGALDSLSNGGKKARKDVENPAATTHEDVMAALRARIERNKTAGPRPASTAPASRRKKVTPPPPSSVLHPGTTTAAPPLVPTPSVAAKAKAKAAATKYPSPPPRAVAIVSQIRSTNPLPPSIPYFTAIDDRASPPAMQAPPPSWASPPSEPRLLASSVRMLLNGSTTSTHANESDLRSS